jgi:hypothetical protein
MSTQFTTIDGLKRRAKRIGREEACKHHVALDAAAREGGFSNFAHALHTIDVGSLPQFSVTLEQWWYNREDKASGTEALVVPLSMPLADLVKPHHLVGYLGGCKLRDENTLRLFSDDFVRDNADYAMRRLTRVARALQFMEITGLRPSDAIRCYPRNDGYNRPPIADHDHCWYHPLTRQFVLSTEPYDSRVEDMSIQMDGWSAKHGFQYARIPWGSIYGYTTQLWLAAKAETTLDLDAIVQKLAATSARFVDD